MLLLKGDQIASHGKMFAVMVSMVLVVKNAWNRQVSNRVGCPVWGLRSGTDPGVSVARALFGVAVKAAIATIPGDGWAPIKKVRTGPA